MASAKEVLIDGLWTKNPGLVQLLGLCPLLAVSSTATNALSLGLATLFVLVISNFTISLIRKIVSQDIRIIIYVVVIASLVTCVQLLMEAYTPSLYEKLGLYIGLIVTNCIIIARAEQFAVKNTPLMALWDGFSNGIGFLIVLLIIGIFREIIGQGTIFAELNELIGDFGSYFKIQLFNSESGLLMALLPPGAFITLGMLVAVKNAIDGRNAKRKQQMQNEVTKIDLNDE